MFYVLRMFKCCNRKFDTGFWHVHPAFRLLLAHSAWYPVVKVFSTLIGTEIVSFFLQYCSHPILEKVSMMVRWYCYTRAHKNIQDFLGSSFQSGHFVNKMCLNTKFFTEVILDFLWLEVEPESATYEIWSCRGF